jgi:hypothetical protein
MVFKYYLACGDLEEDYPSHVYIMGNLGLTYSGISDRLSIFLFTILYFVDVALFTLVIEP